MADLFDLPKPLRPAPLGADLREAVRQAMLFVDKNEAVPLGVLSSATRSRLSARKIYLREAERPPTEAEVAQAWLTFRDMRGAPKFTSAAEVMAENRRRTNDLRDTPWWAIIESVDAFRRGEIGRGFVRPTCGQVRIEAIERAAPFNAELRSIERVLASQIAAELTDEERARRKNVLSRLTELAASIAVSAQGERAKRPAEPPDRR